VNPTPLTTPTQSLAMINGIPGERRN